MNFCKDNDKYISLYIDEMLNDKSKLDFLQHIEECSECAVKLNEASFFAELCQEEQDIQLPEDFSSSLHRRLLEVNVRDSKSKFGFSIYNKKFIASFSTAAILVISLLAYNLLPQMSSKKNETSLANEVAQVETARGADSFYGSTEDKSSTNATAAIAGNSASTYNAASAQSDSIVTAEDAQITEKFSEALPFVSNKTAKPSTDTLKQDKSASSSNKNESSKRKLLKDETAMFYSKSENQADFNNQQYFMNYVELNLKVSPEGIEIDDLRKIMNDVGAIELKSVTINSIVENTVVITVEAPVEPLKYIDYYLPLSIYSTLESSATKYELKLSTRTDIIKTDITNIYNELNNQKKYIYKEIEMALIKSEDASIFEAEKTKLTEEMNKIIAGKEMVTARIFFVDR